MDFLFRPAQAQEDSSGGDQADSAPDGSVSFDWAYSLTESSCAPPYPCTDESIVETLAGSTMLTRVDGGFEGSSSGLYSYTAEVVTRPARGCPSGARSYSTANGSADFVVHAQCSIDNSIIGGEDTSHYDRSTSVVEIRFHDENLNRGRDSRDCAGRTESWTNNEGSAGFSCYFYGVDFVQGGTYVTQHSRTDHSKGTCTLQFNPPPGPRLRIYGTVQGLIDGKPPVPISNARVVAMKHSEPRLQKLSESKPPFSKKTTTSDDERANYEIELDLCGEPSRVVVVSTLWYEGPPVFAVTNGPAPAPGKPGIPVYLAACVDDKPYTHCYKWKKVGDGYEAEVKFEYGSDDQIDRQATFMDSEDLKGNRTTREIMMDSAYIYYNSYRAVKYFDSRASGYPKNPVMIHGHYLEESCVNFKERKGAWFRPVGYAFGDLGQHLETIDGQGAIFMCSDGSSIDAPDAPVNREWHELGHYLQYQMYRPLKSCPNCINHGGHANDNTSWSLIEGFAEFTAALINKYYGSDAPHLYPIGEAVVSLEVDYKSWGTHYSVIDEELAVAGILWDLHDPGKEIALQHMRHGTPLQNSKVYPNPVDEVSLADSVILQVIQKGKPRTVVDLFNIFTGTYVSKVNLDMIFLDHGFFADIVDRNSVHDSLAEIIPQSGNAPNRMFRESTPPSLPGSLLVSDADVNFDVSITFLQGNGQYDYAYVLAMKRDAPAYFTMPPEYYPTKAVFTPVAADGKKSPAIFEITSEEYWSYISSNPAESGIFKRIPAGTSARN